jgi:GNAT superfamily N-acetyltransferase
MFAKYHYLSHYHNNAARVFIATIDDEVCGFCSVLHQPSEKARNLKRVHRLVVLPDYQGIGIGIRLLNEVGKLIISEKYRLTIITSSPSLVFGLKNDRNWRCLHYGRKKPHSTLNGVGHPGSSNRLTTSWELIKTPGAEFSS